MQWWSAHRDGDERTPGELLMELMGETEAYNATLRTNTRRLIRMYEYGARAADGFAGSPTLEVPLDESQLYYPVARNYIETLVSKVSKTRVSPMALTEGGGYLERHRARQVDKALEGLFEERNVDDIFEDVLTDAMVTDHGCGAAKVYERDDCVMIEHVPIEGLRFDHREGRRPRSIYQEHDIDKYMLAHLFPEHREAIMRGSGRGRQVADGMPLLGKDRIMVYEGWHLPSGNGAGDGRHVMAVEGCTLVDEEWTEEHFPFAIYCPRPRRRSPWGLSAMRDCASGQEEYEKLTLRFQRAHDQMGMSGFMVPKGADLPPEAIVNRAGIFVEYSGAAPPTPFTPTPVHSDQYAYRESIVRDMGQGLGISQLSANSQIPAGLSNASGKALQVYEDVEAERLAPEHHAHERWIVELSWLCIHAAKRIIDRGGKVVTRYFDKSSFESIDWGKVVKDIDKMVLRVFPVSQLSKQPAARFAQLQELLNAGAITVEQFRRLYDLPDLESELEMETADTDIIDRMLEGIVVEGRTYQPEPFDNLQLLIQRSVKFYSLCRLKCVPEDRLQALRDFIRDAKELLTPPAPPQLPAQMPPPVMPTPPGPPMGGPPMPPGGGAPQVPMPPPAAA